MRTSPSSVIYTNTSRSDDQDDDDGIARDDFPESLCGNLSVLSLILDLIPLSYISNLSHCFVYNRLQPSSDLMHQTLSFKGCSDSVLCPIAVEWDKAPILQMQ